MTFNNTDITGDLDFSIDDIQGTIKASGNFIDIDISHMKSVPYPLTQLPIGKMSVNEIGKTLKNRGLTVRVCSENKPVITAGYKAHPRLLNRLVGMRDVEFRFTWSLVRLFFLAKRK
tara:strand:- start:110 stop:460 length:351 start_codon:yes stop_codon:yes gene_type:complete